MRSAVENQTNTQYHYTRDSGRAMRTRIFKAEIKKELRLGRVGDEMLYKAVLDYIRATRDGKAAREWKSPVELANLGESRAAENVKKEVLEEEIELAARQVLVYQNNKRSPKTELDEGLTNCLQWGMRRSTESFFGVQTAPIQWNEGPQPQNVPWLCPPPFAPPVQETVLQQPMTATAGGEVLYSQNTVVHQVTQSQMTSFADPTWISSQAGQSPEIIWEPSPTFNEKTIPLVKEVKEEIVCLDDIPACKNPDAAQTISYPFGWPSSVSIEYSTFADIDTAGIDANLDAVEPFNFCLPVIEKMPISVDEFYHDFITDLPH